MKTITFYFDPVSPYAYLAFERLPEALAGLSYEVEYRPILFAALLHALGQKGPAEIESKRQWTFRQVAWQAEQLGIPLQVPAQHPFNPLPLLRLAWAAPAMPGQTPSRRVCEQIFRHVWRGGEGDLQAAVAPQQDPAGEPVKDLLRNETERALKRGVFGVPTFEADGRLFWGLDALPMLAGQLRGDAFFAGPTWDEAGKTRPGVVRRA
ncbi:2-hydroxychromene-2-carboxylate isomerase [Pelomonas sp. KK5]|uniref:2-hydroxychromene-2-carboxylate isomerase n=1 Tax=Pelomonas sp. KK5 TaxID=1855730 RepID=UPI00097BB94D|nr:2-hydroxychromene-2-carboxylate isomerase [Pelomonas sp. KK5]